MKKDWWVGTTEDDGKPIIVRARDGLPMLSDLDEYVWLTVISWVYEGDNSSGMPLPDENERIIELEDILERDLERNGICVQTVSKTGNGLREWDYYIKSRDVFINELNTALSNLPQFPIEINFYKEPDWDSFKDILECRE